MPSGSGLPPQVLLGALLGRGVLTTRQAADIARLVEEGIALEDAIARVPVVNADELGEVGVLAPRPSDSHERIPVLSNQPSPQLTGTSRDDDGVPLLDIGDVEVPFVSESLREKKPAPSPASAPSIPEVEHVDEESLAPIAIKVRATTSTATGPDVPRFNLAEDEGIPLLRQLHEYFAEALAQQSAAMILATTGRQAALACYDRLGTRVQLLSIDAGIAGKMIARLKVMGRLSPWKDDGEGVFVMERRNIRWHTTVAPSREGIAQRVTLWLAEQE